LFDHNVDRRFRRSLKGHTITSTREIHCEDLSNGALLRHAANQNFDAFLSVDKNIEHQQNLKTLPLPVIILDCVGIALRVILPFAPAILKLLEQPLHNTLYVISEDGTVTVVTQPRAKP
jgi:hypothetical protein